jgi:YegS/Rv2252/BmrU family lipid kinase
MPGVSTVEPAGVVLLNAQADGGRALALRRPIEAWLAHNVPGVSLLMPVNAEAAQAMLMILAPCTRVALVGGDGTLHSLLPALMRCGHRVGLVPAGSGNDVARALGVAQLHWAEALAYALHAQTAPIDLGQMESEIGSRYFVSSFSMGFDAAVAARAQQPPRWLPNRHRYLWATLRELVHAQPRRLRLSTDGRTVHEGPALFAAVLNTPTYGSGIPAVPTARLNDHWLDLLVAGDVGRLRALSLLPRLLRGQHMRSPEVTLHSFRRAVIESDEPLPLAADGEVLPSARAIAVQVLPKALHLAGAHTLNAVKPRGSTGTAAGTA